MNDYSDTTLSECIRYLQDVPHPEAEKRVMVWVNMNPRVRAEWRRRWREQDEARAKIVQMKADK